MEDDIARANRARSIEQLAIKITEFAGHMNAATYHWLTMIAEFDRLKGWPDNATQSCAHWLNWKCGIDLGAAREKVRVARALAPAETGTFIILPQHRCHAGSRDRLNIPSKAERSSR